jgi:glutaminyl-tRNA synthetase
VWVSAEHAVPIEARLYDRLFTTEDPQEGGDYMKNINPEALVVVQGAFVEPSMAGAAPGTRVQFERTGYFCVDPDSTPERLVVNRTISLRDSWAKQEQKQG